MNISIHELPSELGKAQGEWTAGTSGRRNDELTKWSKSNSKKPKSQPPAWNGCATRGAGREHGPVGTFSVKSREMPYSKVRMRAKKRRKCQEHQRIRWSPAKAGRALPRIFRVLGHRRQQPQEEAAAHSLRQNGCPRGTVRKPR